MKLSYLSVIPLMYLFAMPALAADADACRMVDPIKSFACKKDDDCTVVEGSCPSTWLAANTADQLKVSECARLTVAKCAVPAGAGQRPGAHCVNNICVMQ